MKKIIWDWNGTLFDDVDLCVECINRLLIHHNVSKLSTIEQYRDVFGFPIIDYYRKAGFDFSVTPYPELAKEYMDDYQPKSYACALNKEAVLSLQYVVEHGGKQAILSASEIENLKNQLAGFDILSYVDDVLGIQNIYAKSKMDIAKEYLKGNQDEVWFIGDSQHDYEVAVSVGANCILVTCGHQSRKRLEECGVKVVDSLLEGVKYIYERS